MPNVTIISYFTFLLVQLLGVSWLPGQLLTGEWKKELYVLGSSGGKRFVHNEPAVLCKFQAMFGKE